MHLYIYTHAIISLLSIAELSYAYRMARDAHHGHAHTRGPAAGVEMICFLSVHLPFGRNIVRRGFAMLHVGPLDRRQRGRRNLLSVCPCGNQATTVRAAALGRRVAWESLSLSLRLHVIL